ncbi:MAG: uncharacterized protein JWN14_172, partial [Chthonomonadales bacterium]|nr:uncharacterized protein [Chthonomonadales bacterium]
LAHLRTSGCKGGVVLLGLGWLLMGSGSAPASAQRPLGLVQAALASKPQAAAMLTAEQIRRSAARAYGIRSNQDTWQLTGSAHFRNAEQTFEMRFDSHFRFVMTMTGALSETDAFDGALCWTVGPSEIPHRLTLRDRDVNRLTAWALTGAWALKSAPLLLETAPASTAAIGKQTLLLKPKDGIVTGTLVLDSATSLPDSIQYGTDSGKETWIFSEYRSFQGRMLPTHIIHQSSKQEDTISITAADPVEADASRYRMTKPDPKTTTFDGSADNTVEIKRVFGLMFIHPKIDGQDVGWFFLDTGADAMCIEPDVAKKLGLPIIGGDTTSGVVGVTHLDISRATTFQLGPVTLPKPVFMVLGLGPISQVFKIPIAGICGYDFLARTALDIDLKANTMRISRPGAAALPAGAKWTKIGFDSNTPCLECAFAEDHKGFFSLDTGSDATVDFFSPAVERFHLLERQDGTKVNTGGAGGIAESRQGKIDWFQLGGTKFEKPTVGFQLTKSGVFASPYRLGNIGMGFLGQFNRLLLDYAHERIALIKTP